MEQRPVLIATMVLTDVLCMTIVLTNLEMQYSARATFPSAEINRVLIRTRFPPQAEKTKLQQAGHGDPERVFLLTPQ